MAIAMMIASRAYDGKIRQGFMLFGTTKLVLAAGLILTGMRGIQADWLTIIIGNTLGLSGFFGSYSSIRIILERKPLIAQWMLVAAVTAIGSWIAAYHFSDIRLLRIFISSITSAVLALITYELLVVCKQPGLARIVGGVTSLCMLAINLIRIGLWISNPQPILIGQTADELEQIFWLILFAGASMTGVNFSLMCNDVFNAELRQMVATDPLTGLANRRRLLERGTEEVNRATRFHHSLSLMMIDIDHFKAVNDTWGHTVGDVVIKQAAASFMSSIRDVDLAGRWGGEEFIVILPETSLATALDVGERLRQMSDETPVPINRDQSIPYSVSIGVVQLRADETIDTLIDRADKAMYRAKQEGRNRVIAEDL
jgi:diguanylate cyclase (GGDEF)-like protein